MLMCCNRRFFGGHRFVLANKEDFYRRIEFGVCPECGVYRFLDYRLIKGMAQAKILSGAEAESAYDKVRRKLNNIRQGSKSNQNYFYGDFKRTEEVDSEGNPVFLQLRKNFNNQEEVIGKVKTKVYKI